jgi:hypothetical protein
VGEFDHEPGFAVSTLPCWAVPEMLGAAVLAGAGGTTTAVGAEREVADPLAFEAVTATTRLEPTSVALSVYVLAVPRGVPLQDAPVVLQAYHAYL